jgi:bacterial/archaeal transporter family-2 protein
LAGGAFYALVTIGVARHLGATTLIALVVVGQLTCSVLVDHFGVLGFEAGAATLARLTGCALLLGGFLLIWRY